MGPQTAFAEQPVVRARPGEARRYYEQTVLAADTDECVIWPFPFDKNNYPKLKYNGKTANVHRLVCKTKNGEPPTLDHQAAHNCNNAACCNWRHLRWATPLENIHDKFENGTVLRGSNHGFSKLTEEQVLEIRSLNGQFSQSQIAKRYSVDQSTISRVIAQKEQWSWLETKTIN